jgi:hypothetical protein
MSFRTQCFDIELAAGTVRGFRTVGLGVLAAFVSITSLCAADVDVSRLPAPAERTIDFASDIKPIFETSCLRCHGTGKPKSGFSLATREAALKGGDNGVAIVPGDSAKSPLIHYVAHLVPDMEMPPEGKGDPLTPEQIAVLRAWIDQGVLWEAINPADYEAKFSFTPAVRWVTVQGNAQKFQQHQWIKRGFSEGVSDFRISQKNTNGTSFFIEGHALTEDYKITLDLRKEDLGFARFGIEQFRHYYDDYGIYYRFRPSGFATQVRNIYSLDRDLHLDIGKAFAEFGLTRKNWPEVIVGYEYHYKNGDKSTQEYGPVSQRNNSSGAGADTVTRHIYPGYKTINEDVHILRLDVSHDIGGVYVEDNLRAEFFDLKTKHVADNRFTAGQVYPTAFTRARDTHDQLLIANAIHGEKSIKDWLFVSGGYLFSDFDADATFRMDTVDGAGRPTRGLFWSANDIVLTEQAHLFNVNILGGPWDGFTAAAGVQNEWNQKSGFGMPNYIEGDPNAPGGLPIPTNGWVTSESDRVLVEENLILRYTKIPVTALFAEARLKQERTDLFEGQRGEHDFLSDTDTALNWQEYKAGFEVSPWRWASLNASYKFRLHETDIDDRLNSLHGYPAFIRSRETESDIVETRLVLKPLSWLKATLSYQLALSDYSTTTDPTFTNDPPVQHSPGGHVFAGEYDVSTYSANVTVTPWRRWYFSGSVSYEESRTWTADNGGDIVVPYRGDTYSVLASSTFLLSDCTDITATYSFSRARFAQHNFTAGLPLGIDYDLHGVQVGVTHRVSTNLTAGVQYGFFDYSEPTLHGFGDYKAHMIFATVAIRLP